MQAIQQYSGVQVDGYFKPGFESVVQQFVDNLQSGEEKGAAFAVTHNNELVVDIWGGYRDKARTMPWLSDSICLYFSLTKGFAAMAMLKLHDMGKFDYDQKVASIWPEFGCNGKEEMTIRTLMNHRGGLPAIDHVFQMEDFLDPAKQDEISAILARQKPLWELEKSQGYHATTYGMYVMEIFRRLTDQPFSEFFNEHIAGPADAEVWVGAPESVDDRMVEIQGPSKAKRVKGMLPAIIRGNTTEGNVGRSFLKIGSIAKRAFLNPNVGKLDVEAYNQPHVRRHALLWANGVGTAKGIAKAYAALANGGSTNGNQIFSPEVIKPIIKRQGWLAPDTILGKPVGWAQGFLKEEAGLFSPGESGFGHSGLGGAVGWADPDNNISFGYVNNALDWRIRSPRCLRLCDSVYRADALKTT